MDVSPTSQMGKPRLGAVGESTWSQCGSSCRLRGAFRFPPLLCRARSPQPRARSCLPLWFCRRRSGEGSALSAGRCAAWRSPCSCCSCSSCCCSSCSRSGKRTAAASWPTTLPAPSCSCSATTAPRPPSPPPSHRGHLGDALLQTSSSPSLLGRMLGDLETEAGQSPLGCIPVNTIAMFPEQNYFFIQYCLSLFILNVYYV